MSAEKTTLTDSVPEGHDHRELKENGQQLAYVVLTKDELAKGFVRPLRHTYVHEVCGASTRMSASIAATYAREPHFYSGTFCSHCQKHFPIGEDGQFIWEDDSKVGT